MENPPAPRRRLRLAAERSAAAPAPLPSAPRYGVEAAAYAARWAEISLADRGLTGLRFAYAGEAPQAFPRALDPALLGQIVSVMHRRGEALRCCTRLYAEALLGFYVRRRAAAGADEDQLVREVVEFCAATRLLRFFDVEAINAALEQAEGLVGLDAPLLAAAPPRAA